MNHIKSVITFPSNNKSRTFCVEVDMTNWKDSISKMEKNEDNRNYLTMFLTEEEIYEVLKKDPGWLEFI